MPTALPVLTLLSLALGAATAPVEEQLRPLVRGEQWEELFLLLEPTVADQLSSGGRERAAAALVAGCEALTAQDAVFGLSLAQRAERFHRSARGLLCLARTARATDQRGAAEEALREGQKAYPKDPRFALELGKLQLDDGDEEAARRALEAIPRGSRTYREATALLKSAARKRAVEAAAQRRAERRAQQEERRRLAALAKGARGGPRGAGGLGLGYESGTGPGGLRTRGNRRFHFKYFNGERDFGQRADYEGKVADALDEAYETTSRLLGRAREEPVDVILYSKEEFRTHFGAARSHVVAGFYSEGAIRMNDASEINDQNRATLVHEYVHAAIEEFCGGRADRLPIWANEGTAEYIEWRYQGGDRAPHQVAVQLRTAALQGRLPSLKSMAAGPLIAQGDPGLRYALSASAVAILMREGGAERLLTLFSEVGKGTPFEHALERLYGKGTAKLDEEVRRELSQR